MFTLYANQHLMHQFRLLILLEAATKVSTRPAAPRSGSYMTVGDQTYLLDDSMLVASSELGFEGNSATQDLYAEAIAAAGVTLVFDGPAQIFDGLIFEADDEDNYIEVEFWDGRQVFRGCPRISFGRYYNHLWVLEGDGIFEELETGKVDFSFRVVGPLIFD